VSYSVFDQPTQIRTTGTNATVTRYAYGPGREIVRRTEGPTVTLTTRSTHYVGGVEVSYLPNQGSVTDRREYKRMVGSALIITMEIERNGTTVVRRSERAYRFVDRQGSVDVLTDRSGTVLQRMGFDAFGQRREAGLGNPWAPSQIAGFDNSRTRKGYTGHEMVDHANLIHMGGRVYDPRLGRFLSADPLVQAPMQSQSWNRYTYVLNNPLNYTDPSGYAWIDNKRNQQVLRTVVSIAVVAFAPQMLGVANHAAMGAGQKIFIGAVSGAIQTGTVRGALISAFSAGVSHGIGAHFDKAAVLNGGTLSVPDMTRKIMAHAVAGGVAESLRGGKFGHGFASAGFVELAGPHVSTALGNSAAGQVVTAAILGGTASHLVGGKFANGALTAAMQWAFNQLGAELLGHRNRTGDDTGDQIVQELYQFAADTIESVPIVGGVRSISIGEFHIVVNHVAAAIDYRKGLLGDYEGLGWWDWYDERYNHADTVFFGGMGGDQFEILGGNHLTDGIFLGGDLNYIRFGMMHAARGNPISTALHETNLWNLAQGNGERIFNRVRMIHYGYQYWESRPNE
jgi:RHS repeat-associated protein